MDNIGSPMELPYLEGDLWPEIIDKCILEAEEELRKSVVAKSPGSVRGERGRSRGGTLNLKNFDLSNPVERLDAL